MKRLQDVAVRMRPRVPRTPDGAPRLPEPVADRPDAVAAPADPAQARDTGFANTTAGPRIPARKPFVPTSRDLARQAAEAADDFAPAAAPQDATGSAPTADPDRPPQNASQGDRMTDNNFGTSRPISRRQIWDLEPEEMEEVASQSVITDRTYLPDAADSAEPADNATRAGRAGAADTDAQTASEAGTAMGAAPEARAGEDDMASRALRALQAAEKQLEARGIPASALYEGEGAKTRVLGFHSPDLETDAISAVARKSVGDVRFPAGWIVVVDGPGRGAYFAVTNSVSSIGRGLDQAICLNFGDASISRNSHAAIAYDAEQNRFFLGHGNKSNIVRRNGQPVLSTEELVNGDTIRIGKTTLRFVALCGADFTWGPDAQEGAADDD